MGTLVNKVESNNSRFFGSPSAGGIAIKRKLAAWEKVTDAVNSVGSEERTLSEVNTDTRRQQLAKQISAIVNCKCASCGEDWFAKSFNNARQDKQN